MNESYRFVVSLHGNGAYQSPNTWKDHKEAVKEGKIWAEHHPFYKGTAYTVGTQLVRDNS